MPKKKIQKPLSKQKWNKQIKIYHNKGSEHFLLGIAEKGDNVAGHDMTTNPSRRSNGKPRKKYLELLKNPNPEDSRKSYIDKKLRKNIRIHFDGSTHKRLTRKKKWKLSKRDKKRISKLDRKKL